MADRAKLLAELTGANAARYAVALAAGEHGTVLAALAGAHPTAKTDVGVVPAALVLAAVAPSLAGLTATALQRLQVVLAPGAVDLTNAETVAEVRDIFSGQTATLQRLAALRQRAATYAEASGTGADASLEDLAAVAPLVPGSLAAQQAAAPNNLRGVFYDQDGAHDLSEIGKPVGQRAVLSDADLAARRGA